MMNRKLKALFRTAVAFVCAVTVCLTALPVYAEDTVESLEQKTNGLQNKLDALNSELGSLSAEITELAAKMEETDEAAKKAELDLAAAKLNEDLQYDSMKMRIKYMYEGGNSSLLQVLFSSKSMGEFLNNVEFVRNVTEYDRNMLSELQEIHKEIQEKEEKLKSKQASLEKMQAEMEVRQETLNSAITSTSGELQASSEALEAAKEAQAAAQKALEEQRKKEEQASVKNDAATDDQGNASENPGGNQDNNSNEGSSTAPSVPADTTEIALFAAILQCEAGSSDYDALLAVATVIMNRVASGKYPNTLQGVIYQSGQFSPTWNGSLNRVLQKGPASLCYQVAQDALGGARLASVSGCYQFRASWTGHKGTVVGGNVFF